MAMVQEQVSLDDVMLDSTVLTLEASAKCRLNHA